LQQATDKHKRSFFNKLTILANIIILRIKEKFSHWRWIVAGIIVVIVLQAFCFICFIKPIADRLYPSDLDLLISTLKNETTSKSTEKDLFLYSFVYPLDNSIWKIIIEGDLIKIRKLIFFNPDIVNFKGESSHLTPLHCAVYSGNKEVALMLIEYGADVNINVNNSGYTPLHEGASQGNEAITLLLIQHGANINGKTCENGTPLHGAVASGSKDTVNLLIEHGADINAKDIKGDTPLHQAIVSYIRDIAFFMIDSELFPQSDCENNEDNLKVSFDYKIWEEKFKITELLIEQGSDINAVNNDGMTPLDIVESYYFDDKSARPKYAEFFLEAKEEMVGCLEKYGATKKCTGVYKKIPGCFLR